MDHLFVVTFKHGCSQKDMYLQLIGQDISEVHPYLSRYYEHVTSVKITDLGHYNPITGLVTESQRIRYNGYVTSNKGENKCTSHSTLIGQLPTKSLKLFNSLFLI